MRITDTLAYIARRTRHEGLATLRGIAYLGVCATALVSFAVLMPSLEYQHVRGTTESRWDVWVTGPLDETDLDSLAGTAGVESLVPALTVTMDSVAGPRTDPDRMLAQGSVTAVAYRNAADLAIGPYPETLLLSGVPPEQGQWACDWSVARRFRLRVGDVVTAHATPPGSDVLLSGRLAGIYGPTGTLKDTIVVPATSDLIEAISRGGNAPWTDAFISSSQPAALVERVSGGPDADRLLAIPRIDLEQEGRTRMLREVGPFLRSGATWAAVAGFLSLALWQQSTRLARRRREHAILAALGTSRWTLVRIDAIEQALRLLVVAGLGIAGALALVEGVSGMYVPRGAVGVAVAIVAITVVATVVVGAIAVHRKLRPESLSDTLARE